MAARAATPPTGGAGRRVSLARLGRAAPSCLAALLAAQGPAAAQEAAADSGRLARAVLADPSDLDLGYRYVQALVAEGRYRDAAAELERMLIVEPGQPRLRLELGVLYFRLGSYEVARSYLERALDAPDLPEPSRERVRRFLGEAERRTRRSVLTGSLSFGGRYQSNANGGVRHDVVNSVDPDTRAFRPFPLPPDLRKREDVNAYIGATLTHSYDLEWQRDAAIVSSFGLAATRQTSEKFYNFAGSSVRSGLRFAPAPDSVPSLRLYPYVRADLFLLNDQYYNGALGPGLEASVDLSARWAASLVLEQRFADYDEAPRAPRANLLTGDERLYLLRLGYRISPDLLVLLQGGAREVGTKQSSFDFTEYGVTGGISALYAAPFAAPGSTRWNAFASVSHYWREYGGPDQLVDLTRTRHETEWRVRLVNEIPVLRNWSAVQHVEYWRNNANLPNYDRDNLIVALGLTLRF